MSRDCAPSRRRFSYNFRRRLERRRKKVIDSERDQIGRGTDREQNGVTGSDVAESVIAIEQPSCKPWEEDAAERSCHPAETNDRADIFLGKHVGNGGEEVRGPRLMRRTR